MKLFLPGDFLATEEEFGSGANTFEENGGIFADSAGTSSEDTRRRLVSIQKPKQIVQPKIDDIVYGVVGIVRTSSISVELFPMKKGLARQSFSCSFAMLPVRNVSRGYVQNIKQEFKIGDIVKAKISEAKPWGIDLRTNEQELGVVKAFCTKCRQPLLMFGSGLKCTSCGNSEQRKLSTDYGKPIEL